MQSGIIPGKGTTDVIFIVRQTMEKYLAKKNTLFFVNLEKSTGTVSKEVMRSTLVKSGMEVASIGIGVIVHWSHHHCEDWCWRKQNL